MTLALKQFFILFSCLQHFFYIFLFVSFPYFISFSSQYNISVTHFPSFSSNLMLLLQREKKNLEGFMCLRFYGTCSRLEIFFDSTNPFQLNKKAFSTFSKRAQIYIQTNSALDSLHCKICCAIFYPICSGFRLNNLYCYKMMICGSINLYFFIIESKFECENCDDDRLHKLSFQIEIHKLFLSVCNCFIG